MKKKKTKMKTRWTIAELCTTRRSCNVMAKDKRECERDHQAGDVVTRNFRPTGRVRTYSRKLLANIIHRLISCIHHSTAAFDPKMLNGPFLAASMKIARIRSIGKRLERSSAENLAFPINS